MASSVTKAPVKSELNTERGIHAHGRFLLHLVDTSYVNAVMEMISIGGLTIGGGIFNPGATDLKWTPQVSMDGPNGAGGGTWKDVKWKDPDATETPAGEQTLNAATNVFFCIHYASYPEYLTYPYFRIKIKSNSTPGNGNTDPEIYIWLK